MTTPRFFNVLVIILLAVSVVSSILAVQFYSENRKANERLADIDRAVWGDDNGDPEGSGNANERQPGTGAYDLLPLLAKKDAQISELRQKVKALQGGEITVLTPPPSAHDGAPDPDILIAVGEPVVKSVAEQQDFLETLDTTWLTEEQLATHRDIQERLAEVTELLADASKDDDRDRLRQTRRRISENVADLETLFKEERRAIFYNWGRQLEYDEEAAAWFADYVEYVNDMTSVESTMQRMWQSPKDAGR